MVGQKYEAGGIAKDGADGDGRLLRQVPKFRSSSACPGAPGRASRGLLNWPNSQSRSWVAPRRRASCTVREASLPGGAWASRRASRLRAPILAGHSARAAPTTPPRLWDDGVIDPRRRDVSPSPSPRLNAPIGGRFGVFGVQGGGCVASAGAGYRPPDGPRPRRDRHRHGPRAAGQRLAGGVPSGPSTGHVGGWGSGDAHHFGVTAAPVRSASSPSRPPRVAAEHPSRRVRSANPTEGSATLAPGTRSPSRAGSSWRSARRPACDVSGSFLREVGAHLLGTADSRVRPRPPRGARSRWRRVSVLPPPPDSRAAADLLERLDANEALLAGELAGGCAGGTDCASSTSGTRSPAPHQPSPAHQRPSVCAWSHRGPGDRPLPSKRHCGLNGDIDRRRKYRPRPRAVLAMSFHRVRVPDVQGS
jgi:hypothetical protein